MAVTVKPSFGETANSVKHVTSHLYTQVGTF